MATQTVRALTIAYSPFYAWEFNEAENATFKQGAVLVTTASGMVQEASTDPTNIVGLAHEDGHNKTTTASVAKVRVSPILPGVIVEGNLVSGAAGSLTVRGTAVGQLVSLIKRTAESDTPWAFDGSDVVTANGSFRIIGLRDASGDVSARVYAVALASRCWWTGGY